MNKRALWSGLAVLAAMTPLPAMAAKEVTLYLMEVPPIAVNLPDRKGIGGDIALEALRRAGYTVRLEVVPSIRAMAIVQDATTRDTLILPLARQTAREPNYSWIAPIAKVNRAFFTLDRKIQSFDEARATLHNIGVARGTAGLNILHEQGFAPNQVYELVDGITASRMLLAGRIDAWYGPELQFKEWLRTTDPQGRVKAGVSLGSTYNYLACSKTCDPAMRARLADEIDKMHKDGTVKTIEARYNHGE
jgi:polar amino acid transport system substrate-binding protein